MRLTRWRIHQLSGSRSPWHSDTLYGCLCWALVHLKGEEALDDMLSVCRAGYPPFVVSDGFPAGFLPLPNGGDFVTAQKKMGVNKKERAEAMDALKPLKRLTYLPEKVFERVLHGDRIKLDEHAERINKDAGKPLQKREMLVHNSINRITGSVLEQALYRSSSFGMASWTYMPV